MTDQTITIHLMRWHSYLAHETVADTIEEAEETADWMAEDGSAAPFAISIGGEIVRYDGPTGWHRPNAEELAEVHEFIRECSAR